MSQCSLMCMFFFFNDTATTEIYTLSLHDALPICRSKALCRLAIVLAQQATQPIASPDDSLPGTFVTRYRRPDRKSTRLNSSHANISYAVFCLKKKKILLC